MIYTVGICDDEKSTCAELENIIIDLFKKMKDDVDIQVWNSAESFMEDVPSMVKVDILFLDIQLPALNGVDVGNYIRQGCNNEAMHIIYISSNQSYAMELFSIHPYEFLIKPIDKDRLCNIIKKLFQLNEQDKRFFMYGFNKQQYRVLIGDILYFRSDKKNIHIVFLNSSQHYVGKLKDEINKLPPDNFVMISQSYIINLRHIKACKLDSVIMENGETLKISRKYRNDFNLKMIEYNKVKR